MPSVPDLPDRLLSLIPKKRMEGKMKRLFWIVVLVSLFALGGCSKDKKESASSKEKASSGAGQNGFDSAEKAAEALAKAMIAKDVKRAQALFPSDALLEKVFPGPDCEGKRRNIEKDREVNTLKRLPKIYRRAAGKLGPNPEELRKIDESEMVGINLSYRGSNATRSGTKSPGDITRGCALGLDIEFQAVDLIFEMEKDGRRLEASLGNSDLLKIGEAGWYVTEL